MFSFFLAVCFALHVVVVAKMVHYKLSYFPKRGAAELAREIFAVAGVDYEDERIPMDQWPDRTRGRFFSYFQFLGMPFGHIPVLEVDEQQLAQTAAIVRYLSRQFGLVGKTPFEEALVDSLFEQFADYRSEIRPHVPVISGLKEGDKAAVYKEFVAPARDKFFGIAKQWLEKVDENIFIFAVRKRLSRGRWSDLRGSCGS